jgi:hypothetical protein
MAWRDRLMPASFRGVPFGVREESGTFGRRVETHEYPGRDQPYTEDLGRTSRRYTLQAYLVGDDYFDQRDALITAVDTPGPGTLVHPFYGEMVICIDGEVRISHSGDAGRMCSIEFSFVEAGELAFPTSGLATEQKLISSSSELDDAIGGAFGDFSLSGLPDFVQNGVIADAAEMLGKVADGFKIVDDSISDAARLLQGDLSVILLPPSDGMDFVNQLQKMWRAGSRVVGDATNLRNMLTTIESLAFDRSLSPHGVWPSASRTTQQRETQRNYVSQAIRASALSESIFLVTELPKPPLRLAQSKKADPTPVVPHPALNPSTAEPSQQLLNWDDLDSIRTRLNSLTARELQRTVNDELFDSLLQIRADFNADIRGRLAQIDRTILRTPQETLPAVVLAADWYDSAQRASDITGRNFISHPGFVPVKPLRVPVR